MRRVLTLSAVGFFALAGCGGSGPTTTTNDFPPPRPSATETQAPVGPIESDGPYGSLGTSSVGPVRFGMTMDQVKDKFGKPDKTEEVSFAGPGVDAPQVDWVYDGKGGETRIQFQTKEDTVTGYRTFSTELSTEDGFKIGDPIDEVNKKYGNLLRDGQIGSGTRLLSEGDPGTYPGITFAYNEETGEITAIEGGMLQPAGD